ncbi:MAG: winged helix DNA-binding domain-containing protein, partial [Candidatus Promineifilaceae bacterium]
VQAQVASAAEMALGVRVDGLRPADVQQALWQERSLVKTWAMRGALHLVAAADLPLLVAARGAHEIRRPPSYYTYHGLTPADGEAILAGVPEVLSATPMTRQELADALAERTGRPGVRHILLGGWGSSLKPSAYQGDLCFGPSQGQNVTFVRPSAWLGAWGPPLEPQAALLEVVRRFLCAFGPATAEEFARWWGTQTGKAKKAFRALGDELVPVEIEGWPAVALAETLPLPEPAGGGPLVRLLGLFDAYVMAAQRKCEPILAVEHYLRVYRPQGWLSAVILVDGRIAGVWTSAKRAGRVVLQVEPFAPLAPAERRGLAAEAERLSDFLAAEVELTFAPGERGRA